MILQKVLKYCPDLNPITGSVTASLLMCQLEYWFDKTGNKPFYKFLEPCADECYKVGDSWVEELGFSVFEFRTAFSKIGKVYQSKTDYMKSKDKFEGKLYLSYRDRIKKRTYYVRNTQAVSKLLLSLQSQCGYSEDYIPNTNSDILSDRESDIVSTTSPDTLCHTPLYPRPSTLAPYDEILELFHRTCPSLPSISSLTPQCKKKIHHLWTYLEQKGKNALHTFKQAFAKVEASDFLCGRTSKSTWCAVLDWILQPKKFFDILSGKYAPFSSKFAAPCESATTVSSSTSLSSTALMATSPVVNSPVASSSVHKSTPTYTSSCRSKPLHTFLRMENHNFDLEQLEFLERAHQEREYEAKLHNLPLASL